MCARSLIRASKRNGAAVAAKAPATVNLVSELAPIIAAIDRLDQLPDLDRLTREAVEFSRGTLGVERVCIYLVESTEPQVVMRGTWGTSDRGAITDERGLAHLYAR